MNIQSKVIRTPNVAIFCRNHQKYLESAIKIEAETPGRPVTFRASTIWKSAEVALNAHGERKIYFVTIGGVESVEYEANLKKILLHPLINDKETIKLLNYCPPETIEEDLWEKFNLTVRTLYVISQCRKLDTPFPFTALTKLSDEKKIDVNFKYSYSIVYEYYPKCGKSPCDCSD